MRQRQLIASRIPLFLLTGLLVLGVGCANLAPITEFADISAQSAAYTGLVTQYVQFPERQKRFQPSSQHARLEQMTRDRAAQRERLLLRQALIEEYMDALGQLAADEPVKYDKEIDALGKAVAANKFAGEKDAAAFGSVSKILFRAAADDWRQRKLRELITESNAPFQDVVGALKRIVDQGFAGDTENEDIAIRNHYQAIVLSSKDKAGIAALEEWRDTRLAEVRVRRQAITDYSEVLSKIASGHQKLHDKRDDLGNKDLLQLMSRYAKDLRKRFDTLKNL
jgi:hypothetical protein